MSENDDESGRELRLPHDIQEEFDEASTAAAHGHVRIAVDEGGEHAAVETQGEPLLHDHAGRVCGLERPAAAAAEREIVNDRVNGALAPFPES
jgi:hypothetical protein